MLALNVGRERGVMTLSKVSVAHVFFSPGMIHVAQANLRPLPPVRLSQLPSAEKTGVLHHDWLALAQGKELLLARFYFCFNLHFLKT